MRINEKKFFMVLSVLSLICATGGVAKAQVDLKQDTLQCHIIGFNIGAKMPSALFSKSTTPDGFSLQDATMASLYKGPYMDYGINCLYKYKSNFLVAFDLNLWFGSNNLQHRMDRMGSLFTRDSIVVGSGGTDAEVECYNRGFSITGGMGKIFPLKPQRNPNSGILARVNAGYFLQQSIFMPNEEHAPQIEGDYGLLYDHQRHGITLNEGVGFWFMSNNANLLNCYVELGVTQCWSWSTRDYVIDNYIGLNGPDRNRYFDLIYSIKLSWMFPLKGKTAHDYYFY